MPGYQVGIIILIVFGSIIGYSVWRDRRRRQRRAMAVALRKEKLQAKGLACVRLVNRTPGVVQVRPASDSHAFKQDNLNCHPFSLIFAAFLTAVTCRWVTCTAALSIRWGCFLR
jgi:hypothetical protein